MIYTADYLTNLNRSFHDDNNCRSDRVHIDRMVAVENCFADTQSYITGFDRRNNDLNNTLKDAMRWRNRHGTDLACSMGVYGSRAVNDSRRL